MNSLLTRDDFRRLVFKRDGHKCVICGVDAEDAHHIVERRLWGDSGGYYLNNGASLCEKCHIQAEMTVLTCDEIRKAAKIEEIILPENLYREYEYDKWGNIIISKQARIKGELFYDLSVQKVLKAGDVLRLFNDLVKYPRTWHCPWSPGIGRDDRVLKDMKDFIGKEIVVTEKLDGENTSCYKNAIHARSIDGRNHVSRNWVKKYHSEFAGEIPDGWRICGENLYAKHTIRYDKLPSYFIAFSIYNDKGDCLGWDETIEWFNLLGLNPPPILYRGLYDQGAIERCYTGESSFGGLQEGYVGRLTAPFQFQSFRQSVFKFVRSGHVGTSSHWMFEKLVKNGLAQ